MKVSALIERLASINSPDAEVYCFGPGLNGKFAALPVGFAEQGELRTMAAGLIEKHVVFLHTYVVRPKV